MIELILGIILQSPPFTKESLSDHFHCIILFCDLDFSGVKQRFFYRRLETRLSVDMNDKSQDYWENDVNDLRAFELVSV